ncbi:MAG TPA: DUF4263 domain-containing protein [candidate division Zixibacteria bacterium]|nr:DUF4263 domain-containing protein [candidate division Zixibacteria bacterium]
MAKSTLIKVKVTNAKSFGKLGDIEVYLTPELKKELSKTKSKRSGDTLLSLFERGMALRGFKHLYEKIREKDRVIKIVFTHDDQSSKTTKQITISYKKYREATSSRFFAIYRETGLDGASFFLNQNFPKDYQYDKARVSDKDLRKIGKQLPEVLKELSQKEKNKKAIIQETQNVIKDLKTKETVLKKDVAQLEQLQRQSNIFVFQQKLKECMDRMGRKYKETAGKNSWQSWIYANNWMFGVNYQSAIEKQKINITGSMPDYLFPTIDGFLDILEIKLPSHSVIEDDASHPGSYRWSTEANKAIGQVVNYLNDIELYQLQLKEEIKDKYGLELHIIKPRAYILIGNKSNWKSQKLKALRKLNYSLHGIEVLTYTDLMQRGSEIVAIYNRDLSEDE